MIDKQKLADKLTEGFILYLYTKDSGVMSTTFAADAIERYRNEARFHREVRSLVANTLNLVDECDATEPK